jgi:hypothetical protein
MFGTNGGTFAIEQGVTDRDEAAPPGRLSPKPIEFYRPDVTFSMDRHGILSLITTLPSWSNDH